MYALNSSGTTRVGKKIEKDLAKYQPDNILILVVSETLNIRIRNRLIANLKGAHLHSNCCLYLKHLIRTNECIFVRTGGSPVFDPKVYGHSRAVTTWVAKCVSWLK